MDRTVGMPAGQGRKGVEAPLAAFARRALVVAFGYGVAVLVSVLVTVSHVVLPSALPDNGALGSFHGLLRDGPSLLMGGLAITFPTALPGFLLALALAARRGGWDSFRFAVAGGLDAILALLIFGAFGAGLAGLFSYLAFCCFGGGLAGGFAYWLVAESRRQGPVPGRLGRQADMGLAAGAPAENARADGSRR